jgi:hypothetical protein
MKAIIDGKIYDTETAERIAEGVCVEVYRTKKGNWFKRTRDLYTDNHHVEPIGEKEARDLIGLNAPDRYDKYFGRAETA